MGLRLNELCSNAFVVIANLKTLRQAQGERQKPFDRLRANGKNPSTGSGRTAKPFDKLRANGKNPSTSSGRTAKTLRRAQGERQIHFNRLTMNGNYLEIIISILKYS